MSDTVDVGDMSDAEVLMRLYNNAGAPKPESMGWLSYRMVRMLREEADQCVRAQTIERRGRRECYFDYLFGRVLKTDVAERPVNVALYDRDHGPGAGKRALER